MGKNITVSTLFKKGRKNTRAWEPEITSQTFLFPGHQSYWMLVEAKPPKLDKTFLLNDIVEWLWWSHGPHKLISCMWAPYFLSMLDSRKHPMHQHVIQWYHRFNIFLGGLFQRELQKWQHSNPTVQKFLVNIISQSMNECWRWAGLYPCR